ncbi:DNA repair helicase RAD25, partial [Tilletia horrida]
SSSGSGTNPYAIIDSSLYLALPLYRLTRTDLISPNARASFFSTDLTLFAAASHFLGAGFLAAGPVLLLYAFGTALFFSGQARIPHTAPRPSTRAHISSTPSSPIASLTSLSSAMGTPAHVFNARDFIKLPLKLDQSSSSRWISPDDGQIIMDWSSSIGDEAQDFLVAIAEPVSRPARIHEYKFTGCSLYAAVSVGLLPNDIILVLNRLSKIPVPDSVVDFPVFDFHLSGSQWCDVQVPHCSFRSSILSLRWRNNGFCRY